MSHRRTNRFLLSLLLLGVCLALPIRSPGQSSPTGSLSGVVQDPNGAVLPGVEVIIKNTGTGFTRTTTTSAEGRWVYAALPVGAYEITYRVAGFKTLKREKVDVEAAVPRTLEDELEVGEIEGASITITEGAALATPDTSAIARQITADQLVQVPTSTRSFTQLLSAEAGVNTDLSPVTSHHLLTAHAPLQRASHSMALMRPTSPATKAHSTTTSPQRPKRSPR
jgi:hypothetical protein